MAESTVQKCTNDILDKKEKAAVTEHDEESHLVPEEEIVEGNWKTPQVDISEVKVETGEESEEVFWQHRAKLFRRSRDEWKERGIGEAKLLQHKDTHLIRFLLRQEKTLKIVANHYVYATDIYCKLMPNVGSEKIWVWSAFDYAEDVVANELFALKFGQVEQATIFKKKFEEAAAINAPLLKAESQNQTEGDEKAKTSQETTKETSEESAPHTDEKSETKTADVSVTKKDTADEEKKKE